MLHRLGLLIEPLDVLLFRDGRPFNTGMRATGGLPLPQTLAGALRTHVWRQLGMDFDALAAMLQRRPDDDVTTVAAALLALEHAWAAHLAVSGPWLYTTVAGVQGPLVPAPADLVTLGKKNEDGPVQRLQLRRDPPPGWQPPQAGLLPLWHAGHEQVEPASGYLTLTGLGLYLNGGTPLRDHVVKAERLYTREDRIGVAVDVDRYRAADHMLYAVRFLRLLPEVRFYAEVAVDTTAIDMAKRLFSGTLAFGGEGRQAQVRVLDQPVDWPQPTVVGVGTLTLLLTPGIFGLHPSQATDTAPWRPEHPALPALVTATVPGALAISGWDLARHRPKPTRYAVVAGSVYYWNGPVNSTTDTPFVRLHAPNRELDALGYGLALRGVWNYA